MYSLVRRLALYGFTRTQDPKGACQLHGWAGEIRSAAGSQCDQIVSKVWKRLRSLLISGASRVTADSESAVDASVP
jgi:hypothetical protein